MLRGTLRTLIATSVSLLFLLPIQSVHAGELPVDECKIKATNLNANFRLGWPRSSNAMPSLGRAKLLVLAVDFSDAPYSQDIKELTQTKAQLGKVSEFFTYATLEKLTVQFDIFPRYVRMPLPSTEYGQMQDIDVLLGNEYADHRIARDATSQVQNLVVMSDYDGVIVIVTGGKSLSGYVGLATSAGVNSLLTTSGEIHNFIVLGMGAIESIWTPSWRLIVHEIGHLLGLPDLYIFGANGFWQAKSTAPFGIMSSIQYSESDTLAYPRWYLGWIPDRRVLCLDASATNEKFPLNTINTAIHPYTLILIKLNDYQVLAIDAISQKAFSFLSIHYGLLVYIVDSSVPTGSGPINLLPFPTAVTKAELSASLPDWIRFIDSPMKEGQFLRYGNYVIANDGDSEDKFVASIYYGNDAEKVYNDRVKNQSASTIQVRVDEAVAEKANALALQEYDKEATKKFTALENAARAAALIKEMNRLKTIACVKGKITKKVIAKKPKCPVGYRKR